jgi:hypothetical protein
MNAMMAAAWALRPAATWTQVRPRQRNDTHVLGSDWNLSSAPPLSEGTNDIGGNYGSRSFAVVDRHTYPDHPSGLH